GAVPSDRAVPATVVLPGDRDTDALIAELAATDERFVSGVVVLSDRSRHDDLHHALDTDVLRAVARLPWAPASLSLEVGALVRRWLHDHAPDGPRRDGLRVDRRPFQLPRSDLLSDLELDE